MLTTACQRRTVYNHYEHTPLAGWEKNDTLNFYVPPVGQDGLYREEVGLRISGDYPFMGLNLVIEQTIAHHTRRDTLVCAVIDDHGNATGRGVSQYQYRFPLTTLHLNRGDALHVTIRHDMKREILPGIADIGLRLTRETDTNPQVQQKQTK